MQVLIVTGLLLSGLAADKVQASTLPFHESKAWFCQQCTDVVSARTVAARYLAPLQCTENGVDANGRLQQSCGAPSRRIVLIQPDTKQVFAFVGRYEFVAPQGYDMQPVVYDTALSAGDAAGFQMLADYYHDVRQTFRQLSLQSVQHGVSLSLIGEAAMLMADAGQCPTETALNYYLDPAKMDLLKTSVTVAATRDGHPLNQYIYHNPRLSAASAGVTVGQSSFSADFEFSQNNVRYIHEFTQSEIPNSVVNDRLVFDVTMSGFDTKNWPILGLALRLPASKIANAYGGEGLNTKTDNPCVAELLNRLAASGAIQLRSDGKGITGIGDVAKPVNGGGRETCLIEVWQWGRLQAQFVVPKTRQSCSGD